MLTDSDLAFIRSQQTVMLPDTCTIQRNTLLRGPSGGTRDVWANLATGVPCRFAALLANSRAGESVRGDREVHEAAFVITLPVGTDVTPKDRIIINSRMFEITGHASGSWATVKRMMAVEVT